MSFPQYSLTSLFDVSSLTVVITGGGSGLGRDMAIALVSNGATVFGVGRRLEALQEVEESLGQEKGKFIGCILRCDEGGRGRMTSTRG